MKIIVKQEGKPAIRLWLPTRVILSNTAARIMAKKAARKNGSEKDLDKDGLRKQILDEINPEEIRESIRMEIHEDLEEELDSLPDEEREKAERLFSKGSFFPDIPPEAAVEAVRILRKMKKDHPGVPLVDVQAADGTEVLIKL